MINNPTPASTPTPTLARGDKITSLVNFHGTDVEARGKVHRVNGEQFFVQLKVGATVFNRYLNLADEGATWQRGWGNEE